MIWFSHRVITKPEKSALRLSDCKLKLPTTVCIAIGWLKQAILVKFLIA